MNNEAYTLAALKELMQYCYKVQWFSGRKTPLTIKMEAEYEGFSGQASNCWEQRWIVETQEIIDGHNIRLKHVVATGETLEEACVQALKKLKPETRER
jgi:hypothetical protein